MVEQVMRKSRKKLGQASVTILGSSKVNISSYYMPARFETR